VGLRVLRYRLSLASSVPFHSPCPLPCTTSPPCPCPIPPLYIASSVNVAQFKTFRIPCLPSREGHVGVARLLLEAGADVETPDNYGQTPFFMACWKGQLLLISPPPSCHSLSSPPPSLMSPLPHVPSPHLSSPPGHADVAALLLEYDANKDCRTKTGITPLFQVSNPCYCSSQVVWIGTKCLHVVSSNPLPSLPPFM